MDQKIEKEECEKINASKKISTKEGSATGLMEGFGTRYITPYALALGVSNIFIALISSLPSLIGNISQLHTLRLMKKKSRKNIVFTSVLTQALLWIPIMGVGIFYLVSKENRSIIPLLFLICYTLMVVSGSIASPAWNSWMKDLIKIKSGWYFGRRNRIVGIVIIISMLIAGSILSYFKENFVIYGFFIIFSIAFLGRLISAYFFTKQYEPRFVYEKNSQFSLKDFIKKMKSNNFGRFVIFISLVSFAVSISAPFFAVYMLKNLNFSYISFTFVTLSSQITTIFFMPVWGKFADKFGNVRVLKITGWLIPLIPFLWLLSFFIYQLNMVYFLIVYLILIEFFSGFIWSGFNLSTGNFIYDAVTREKMAFCVSYFNIINSFGAFIGAVMGGLIATKEIILGFDSILFLFVISGLIRFIAIFIFRNSIKEVRGVPNYKIKKHLKQIFKKSKINLGGYVGLKPLKIENENLN